MDGQKDPTSFSAVTSTNKRISPNFFWSNSYEIEVMITSLIEMLELPNLGYMKARTRIHVWKIFQKFKYFPNNIQVHEIMFSKYSKYDFLAPI